MRTIRWGIIGCGQVTEMKSGPAFQKVPGSTLTAVMRRDAEKAADYARRHNVPRWYDNATALIEDPEVDAVYIATPPHVHMHYTLEAAKAGKPVYCEKPLGFHYEQSRTMVEYCKERQVPLYVAYYRRALPKFTLVKKLLSDGTIGTVRSVSVVTSQSLKPGYIDGSDWKVDPKIAGGGLFHDVACHTLDLLDWLFGPIVEARGFAGRQERYYEADDIVSGSWVFDSGVHGSGIWTFQGWGDYDSVEIIGSLGTLAFSVMDLFAPLTVRTEGEERTIGVPDPPEHVAQPLIAEVVQALLGNGVCSSTGESGVRTDWVMSRLAI